jgi:hypothetical protein
MCRGKERRTVIEAEATETFDPELELYEGGTSCRLDAVKRVRPGDGSES